MRKFLFLFLMFLAFQQANAQLIKVGLRGGVSSSSISASDLLVTSAQDAQDLRIKAGESKLGIHGGLFARINVPVIPLYIQPELLISSTGGEYEIESIAGGQPRTAEVNFTRFDIPVLVGWKLGPARVNLGPVATFQLSESNGLTDAINEAVSTTANASTEYKGATFGYQAGVGLDIWKLAFDLKYEGNLSKMGESIAVFGNSYSTDTRNNQLLFSIGYWF